MCRENELRFSVFVLHSLAEAWQKTPSEVYAILNGTRILDDYVIKCYDTLHTLGREYLIDDITSYVNERGVAV